nr:1131_t:CDS:2 [Entrophospora candida]
MKDNDSPSMTTTSKKMLADTFIPDEDLRFVERCEPYTICQTRNWILSSGTDMETKQLFSTEDWTEMLKNFENEIEIIKEDIPDIIYLFFDKVEQNNEKNENIMMDYSTGNRSKAMITLNEQDKTYMIEIKRVVLT